VIRNSALRTAFVDCLGIVAVPTEWRTLHNFYISPTSKSLR